MGYKLAIFDMDGTILNTLEDLHDSVNAALMMNNLPIRTIDEVRNFVGNGIKMLIHRALYEERIEDGNLNLFITQETEAKVFEDFKRYYEIHCADKTAPYEGINKLLIRLRKAGIKTAVVSNKADFAVKSLCDDYFKDLFDASVGEREAYGVRKKPSPDEVNIILNELKVLSNEAIYIGDSDVDIQTALNSKMDMCIVTWGFRDEEFLKKHGARNIAHNVDEVFNYIMGC